MDAAKIAIRHHGRATCKLAHVGALSEHAHFRHDNLLSCASLLLELCSKRLSILSLMFAF